MRKTSEKKPKAIDQLQQVAIEHERLAHQIEKNMRGLESELHETASRIHALHPVSKGGRDKRSRRT
ncbi:MAG TPA: hypothetical protein VFZ59_03550 [Verrucomicrobiae bacterium]|nr:hypothetical protein [Verrucomicrobiae bacterium]